MVEACNSCINNSYFPLDSLSCWLDVAYGSPFLLISLLVFLCWYFSLLLCHKEIPGIFAKDRKERLVTTCVGFPSADWRYKLNVLPTLWTNLMKPKLSLWKVLVHFDSIPYGVHITVFRMSFYPPSLSASIVTFFFFFVINSWMNGICKMYYMCRFVL